MKNIVALKDPRTKRIEWVGISKYEPDAHFVRNRQLWPSSNNCRWLKDWITDLSMDSEYPEPVLLEQVTDVEAVDARSRWVTRIEQEQGEVIGARHSRVVRPEPKFLATRATGRPRLRAVEGGKKALHRSHLLLGRSTG